MEGKAQCIECGGVAAVSRPSLTVHVEECMDCGRRSHWRVCLACGEFNGPRRAICLECGIPFEYQETVVAARSRQREVVISGSRAASKLIHR